MASFFPMGRRDFGGGLGRPKPSLAGLHGGQEEANFSDDGIRRLRQDRL